MIAAIKRWGLAILILLAWAVDLQFGLHEHLLPQGENACLSAYIIPNPLPIAQEFVDRAGVPAQAVTSYYYAVKDGEIHLVIETISGAIASPICWQGDSLAPTAHLTVFDQAEK